MINTVAELWREWIGDDAAEKFLEYGYYSKKVKLPGFAGVGASHPITKFISMNTQSQNAWNFPKYRLKNDPGKQMKWLEKELKELESVGGQAILIGHKLFFEDSSEDWLHRFRALHERYQHVIRGVYLGHDHKESFHVTTSLTNPAKLIGINHAAGSLTTYEL